MITGVKVEATVTKDMSAIYYDEQGERYTIGLSEYMIPRGTKDTINLYYLKNNPQDAIVLSSWLWWIFCFALCLFFIIWPSTKLYKGFRKEKLIRSNVVYEKKHLEGKEIGKFLKENMSYYSRDLYERHISIAKEDTIKIPKAASEEERMLLEEQERIWKVASVYLAVFRGEEELNEGIRKVVFTNADKYISDPQLFYEDVINTEDISDLKFTYEMKTYICPDMLPDKGKGNRFYLVIAKPGISEYALMLPEWYYMKEELENF